MLLSEKRKNHISHETQTTRDTQQQAVQTDRAPSSVSEIIQETLRLLNRLTPDNDNLRELEAIERIYSFLRREKIAQLQEASVPHLNIQEDIERHSQRTEKKAHSPTSRLFANSNGMLQPDILASLVERIAHNETVGSIEQEPNREEDLEHTKVIPINITPIPVNITPIPVNIAPISINLTPRLASALRGIYGLYFSHRKDVGQL